MAECMLITGFFLIDEDTFGPVHCELTEAITTSRQKSGYISTQGKFTLADEAESLPFQVTSGVFLTDDGKSMEIVFSNIVNMRSGNFKVVLGL